MDLSTRRTGVETYLTETRTVEEGKIDITQSKKWTKRYTELELVTTVLAIARQYGEGTVKVSADVLLAMAKDELAVKEVCD